MKKNDYVIYISPARWGEHIGDGVEVQEGFSLLTISAPFIGNLIIDEDLSVLGVEWESDGPDFAYAVVPFSDDLVQKLQDEGYVVNDDNVQEN